MFLNIFMSILSVALEAFFLLVLRLGIAGAALGTCLGMAVTAVVAYVPFFRGRMLLRFQKPRFSRAMIQKIVSSGAPNFLKTTSPAGSPSILMNVLLVRLGGEIAVSIYGVLMYVEGFIQPLLYGMCDSLQPAVGYNWGARAFPRVKAIEKCCFTRRSGHLARPRRWSSALFPEPIARIFIDDVSAEAIADTVFALRLFSLTYLTRWFSFATQSFMLAIERAGAATLISVSTALIFPGAADRSAVAAGADGPCGSTLPALRCWRARWAAGGHAAPKARLEGLDEGKPRGAQGNRLTGSEPSFAPA